MYNYYVHRKAAAMPHFDVQPDHPLRYADIRDMLLARAAKGPVFFKDMSYYVMPRLLEDAEFVARICHVFLIRMPEAAIASYHKLDPDVSDDEIGLVAQWDHYQGLVAAGHRPLVLRAEDIRNDPKGMMAVLWRYAGLPDAPHAFNWADAVPEDWEQVEAWHGAVSQSRGILPMPDGYAAKARDDFAARAAHAPHLKEYLARHQPAYDALSAMAASAPGAA